MIISLLTNHCLRQAVIDKLVALEHQPHWFIKAGGSIRQDEQKHRTT